MFCQSCGAKNAEGAAFCTKCGAKLDAAAPSTAASDARTRRSKTGRLIGVAIVIVLVALVSAGRSAKRGPESRKGPVSVEGGRSPSGERKRVRPNGRSSTLAISEARQRAKKALQLFEMNKKLAARGANYQSWHEDEKTVGRLWKKVADMGDPEAQNAIGVAYADGKWGFPQDDGEACKWFDKSARQDNENAQFHLGVRYLSGKGVRRNEREGVKWLQAASNNGQADAQYRLGLCLRNGIGARKSGADAVKWFKSAALSGHQKAQLELGKAYLSGIGGAKSPEDGVKWVNRCLEQENFFYPTDASLEARAVLGLCYQYGLGMELDAEEAGEQFKLAERFGTDENLAELKEELHLK